MDEQIIQALADCDAIWHAGDFGSSEVINQLSAHKPLRGVWGNIDDAGIRSVFPENDLFYCEEVNVLMTHIGGYPGRYAPRIKSLLQQERPRLFICGHSHILKIMFDEQLQCLHINPGAAGRHGWHQMRTLVRITIDGNRVYACEVVELGKRGAI